MNGPREIDPDRLAAAHRLRATGALTDSAFIVWAMAETGISHRDIAILRHRSKGTITEQLTRARRLIDQETTCPASEA